MTLWKYVNVGLIDKPIKKRVGRNINYFWTEEQFLKAKENIKKRQENIKQKARLANKLKIKAKKIKTTPEYIHPKGWNTANKAFNKAMRTT